jgi:hypothetical protein
MTTRQTIASTSPQARAALAALPTWIPALVLAILATVSLPRGADWPAQLFRVELFRQEGFIAWNGHWYSGHPTPGYSVLFPPLGATLGVTLVGLASVAAAAVCFHLIASHALGSQARLGSLVFGLGLAANLVVGRITFGLGLAIGLAAILAVQRDRRWLGAALALVTPLASPVAGVFLALALAGWALSRLMARDRHGALALAGIAALGVLPVAVSAVVFPGAGTFDFPSSWLLATIGASVALLIVAQRSGFGARTGPIVVGAWLYLAVALLTFVVPNPMGGNLWRLAMFFAVPLGLMLLAPRYRALTVPLVCIGLFWTWAPAALSVVQVTGDPSSKREFHAPLIAAIDGAPGPPGRVEIPFTRNHWEAFYVAAELPIARGWERQADIARNALFYEQALGERAYRRWLQENAVRWVALPRVGLDPSARAEAELIASEPSWLRPVWSNDDWRLWEVRDATAIVSAPATAVRLTPSEVAFDMPEPGWVAVRTGHSPHWAVADDRGCIRQSGDNGVVGVDVERPGRVVLRQGFFPRSGC